MKRPAVALSALCVVAKLSGCGALIGVGSLSGGSHPDAGDDGGDDDGSDGKSSPAPSGSVPVGPTPSSSAPAPSSSGTGAPAPSGSAVSPGPRAEAGVAVHARDAASPGGCSSDALRWVSWTGVDVPKDAFVLGSEPAVYDAGMVSVYGCRARDGDDVIPGKFVPVQGCFYSVDGTNELAATSFDVLVDPKGCLGLAEYKGAVPPGALVAGDYNGTPLYACAAVLNFVMGPTTLTGTILPGYFWETRDNPNAACRVTYGGMVYDLTGDFGVLTTR